MSSMVKLIPCSKASREQRHDEGDRHIGLLFRAFFVFSVASVMFVTSVAVDHLVERNKLNREIAEIEEQLEVITRLSQSTENGPTNMEKTISELIAQKRRCDPTQGILEQLSKRIKTTDGDISSEFEMWDDMPKAFLHLVGKELSEKETSGNVEGLKTVSGWATEAGGGCTDTDPQLHGTDIIIPKGGNYSVYSQLTFHTGKRHAPTVHRHVVQYIEVFGDFQDEPKILMENAYQLNPHASKISYQSGVYRFNENDILRVLVQKAPSTTFHKKESEGVEASFGVYVL